MFKLIILFVKNFMSKTMFSKIDLSDFGRQFSFSFFHLFMRTTDRGLLIMVDQTQVKVFLMFPDWLKSKHMSIKVGIELQIVREAAMEECSEDSRENAHVEHNPLGSRSPQVGWFIKNGHQPVIFLKNSPERPMDLCF